MKRRNFIKTVIGGLVVIPLVEGKSNKQTPEPKLDSGTWYLTHKESRSGFRCTDVRLVLDSTEAEETLTAIIKRNQDQVRRILYG